MYTSWWQVGRTLHLPPTQSSILTCGLPVQRSNMSTVHTLHAVQLHYSCRCIQMRKKRLFVMLRSHSVVASVKWRFSSTLISSQLPLSDRHFPSPSNCAGLPWSSTSWVPGSCQQFRDDSGVFVGITICQGVEGLKWCSSTMWLVCWSDIWQLVWSPDVLEREYGMSGITYTLYWVLRMCV